MSSDTQKPVIKLVATDIDGTLLNSEHALSERNVNALRAASEQGVHIVLATGKSPASAAPIVDQIKLPIYGIFIQGLLTSDTNGRTMSQKMLDPDVSRQVITFAEDRGFTVMAYSGSRLLARRIDQMVLDHTVPYHEPTPEQTGPLQNLLWGTPLHKIVVLGEPRAILGLRWQLNAQLGGSARVVQAGVPSMVEILPPGGGKGAALKALLKELQVPTEQVLAIGDAENDIEMIQLAGIGVAVGNADQKTKDAAKHVVASNNDDGVAEALERFVLPAPPQPTAEAPASIDTTG